MKQGYEPQVVQIVTGEQRMPTREDIEWLNVSVKKLRAGKGTERYDTVRQLLQRWRFLRTRFGINKQEELTWRMQSVTEQAKSAVWKWRSKKDTSQAVCINNFLTEQLPPESIGSTLEELERILHVAATEEAKLQLGILREGNEAASVELFVEAMGEAGIGPEDLGTTEQELRSYALREAKHLVAVIRGEVDGVEGPASGGLLSIVDTGLITLEEVGMSEEEFNEYFSAEGTAHAHECLAKCREGNVTVAPTLHTLIQNEYVTLEELGTTQEEIQGFLEKKQDLPQ